MLSLFTNCRTLTETFHQYKSVKHLAPEVFEIVTLARKKRAEILHFCQRIYLRLRRLLYGDGIPSWNGQQLQKKRRKGTRSKHPDKDDEPKHPDQVITVASLFDEEATESREPREKPVEPRDNPIEPIDKPVEKPMEVVKSPANNGNIFRSSSFMICM